MADSKNEPMGGGIPEDRTGQVQPLSNRNVWAIDVLIAEVEALFQTVWVTSEPNRFNANTVVEFSPAKDEEWEDMALVMPALRDDERIAGVTIVENDKTITVEVVANAVLYDTRDPFGLDDAVLGLDRQITPDDLTEVAAEIALGEEGFTEGSL